MAKTIKLTKEGKEKLEQELLDLKSRVRLEIAEKIKTARSYGDLSENSEYDEAKDEQAKVEARIADLEVTLKNVVIVDEDTKSSKTATVKLGHSVTVLDVEYNEEETYTIVGSVEANPTENKISDDSPLGAALLGKKEGSVVVVDAPVGEIEYKIIKILK